MPLAKSSYLVGNSRYWENANYDATNVGHPAFKFYGLILKPDFNMTGENGENLLDWGCGRGANVNYFNQLGFKAQGMDMSESDIEVAKIRYPHIAHRFTRVSPSPSENTLPIEKYDVITAIQSLYYLSNTDFKILIDSLYSALKPNGIFYATMMGISHGYFEFSKEHEDGLRQITFNTKRGYSLEQYFVNFTQNKEHLIDKLSAFKPVHIGYYDEKYREDEGSGFHWTFVGQKIV
ncbi:class I SAM-dependent methyltransferase [Candidatus Nucleicultrix amoebiphila]|jgi:2-polyprenyl-3-methyl-5-hydroxy-6-metoxy-1,4-benzoquinol methylase|uniref:Methyltransferase domain-containing protein n=1 Tax=Candidatus Nucleicultrix amoebiphila FS5 TaxID=1414854 RepID=A0A1W6N5G6_9PROT|nr:class I SAM-dependent methyltransferase [Candidatus Nucleicultrix amoebiphila]ARN85051.1 hypothetical protein GQ61_06840 [Candidatus Nucleicultrix amoebiphila FS5]